MKMPQPASKWQNYRSPILQPKYTASLIALYCVSVAFWRVP